MTGTPFFDRRFVVACGKGGVGRSSICAAVAMEAARRGKRVLVCELNTKERIPSLLGARPVGQEIKQIWTPDETGTSGGIWCVNIVPEHAMREYGLMKLRVRALYRVAFENRLVRGFLRLVPGLPELLMLGKAFFHERELDPVTGRPRWDMVVIDAPATGHGISLLRIPQVVLAVTSIGPMAEDARRMQQLLTDPNRTSLNIVTLPEAMPVSEAIDLREQLEGLLRLPTGFVFLNAFRSDEIHPGSGEYSADTKALEELQELAGRSPDMAEALAALAATGARRAVRSAAEQTHAQRLHDEIRMPVVPLPFVATSRWGPEAIEELSRGLAAAVAAQEGS